MKITVSDQFDANNQAKYLQTVTEYCCEQMDNAFSKGYIQLGLIEDNGATFTEGWEEYIKTVNINRYDPEMDLVCVMPIKFCPFCAEEITITDNDE